MERLSGWKSKFTRGEVEHGDKIDAVAVSPSLSLGCLKDAVEPFHKGIGETAGPVAKTLGSTPMPLS